MPTEKRAIIGFVIIFACLTGVFYGCDTIVRKKIEWDPAKPSRPSLVHTVKWPGETLSVIAKWYTGDSRNWKLLAGANPGIDPYRVTKNTKIVIPGHLLTTRRPLPEKYAAQFLSQTPKTKQTKKTKKTLKQKSKPAAKPQEEDEEEMDLELFGPKDMSSQ